MGRKEQRRLIVTKLTIRETPFCACALYHGNQLVEVQLEAVDVNPSKPTDKRHLMGNIYVGRVKDVVKSLDAAFVEIAPGLACYLSLKDVKSPVYVQKANSPRPVQGDQLLVQVEAEAQKTKPPKLTTNLTFHGPHLVVSTQEEAVGASKKLPEPLREHFKELLSKKRRMAFGVIARTACRSVSDEVLLKELWKLEREAAELIAKAPYRTCFSCLRQRDPLYLQMLQQISQGGVDEIVTDLRSVYVKLEEYAPDTSLRFYEDSSFPLEKCYCLQQRILEGLKERVWLKSGGYLVIEPTEALTVIDVNSGKSTNKKEPQEQYRKVNLEAAEEIARQLRLRNLSGIILVDFIDLKAREDQELLMGRMKELVLPDPAGVQVVDYTRLNLMELTRKKGKKSLAEQVGG